MQICSSYRYAVSQHQCTAALPRAKLAHQCSVLLCKTGSQLALCHCSYSYADLIFIHMCSESAQMHCSTAQSKMSSPVSSFALQNRLTACTLSLCLHLCRFALHTGMQCASTNALQHCPEQNELTSVQCCSAKQAHSLHFVTVVTPMQICSSYMCAVSQHKCTAALPRGK